MLGSERREPQNLLPIILASMGEVRFPISGLKKDLTIDGLDGTKGAGYRLLKVPSEASSLPEQLPDILKKAKGEEVKLAIGRSLEALGVTTFAVFSRTPSTTIDYLELLVNSLYKFGEYATGGLNQEEATKQTLAYLDGLASSPR